MSLIPGLFPESSPNASKTDIVASRALIEYHPFSLETLARNSTVDAIGRKSLETKETEQIPQIPLKDRRLCHVLPPLTGPHPVSRTTTILEVSEADARDRGTNKNIGIEVLAPCRNHFGKSVEVPVHYFDSYFEKNLTESQVQTLETHAINRDSLDPLDDNIPIIIFSHGFGVDPAAYRPLLEELASHQYLVLNLNHPGSSGFAEFSKDEAKNQADFESFSTRDCKTPDEKSKKWAAINKKFEEMQTTQEANIRLVIELVKKGELQGLPKNINSESPIVVAGHSLGGDASVTASRDNPNIAGCINLDGNLESPEESRLEGLKIPLLQIIADLPEPADEIEIEIQKKMVRERKTFLENSPQSTLKEITGAGHMDFTIYPFTDWLFGEPRADVGLKTHKTTSKEILNFMKDILKR